VDTKKENTTNNLEEEIKKLRAENNRLRADSQENAPKEIIGTFSAEIVSPDGKKKKNKYKFKKGHAAVRIPNGLDLPGEASKRLSTEGLLQLAAKGKVDERYIKDSPELSQYKKEDAIRLLTWLASIKYGGLEVVS
jgi:hypothetical protein